MAAIVLNYNGREITLEAIGSLLAMTYPEFDVLHVDNGSSDGSTRAVREAFPEVRTVRVADNVGPAGGQGAAREAVEVILRARGAWQQTFARFTFEG